MKPVLSSTLKGLVFAAVFGALFLLISGFILIKCDDPDRYLDLCALISLFGGAFIGGFASAGDGENKLLCGVFTGIVLMLVLFLFSLVFGSRDKTSALRMLLTVMFSVAGAFIRPGKRSGGDFLRKRKNVAKKYGIYR